MVGLMSANPTWSSTSMALAEQERRALVTVIDGHIAIVLPQSLTAGASDHALAQIIVRLSEAIDTALRPHA